jgi:hypothetical protein
VVLSAVLMIATLLNLPGSRAAAAKA